MKLARDKRILTRIIHTNVAPKSTLYTDGNCDLTALVIDRHLVVGQKYHYAVDHMDPATGETERIHIGPTNTVSENDHLRASTQSIL